MSPSQPRDASYMELLWPLVLRGNAVGRLDWLTGVLSLDVSTEIYEALPGAGTPEDHAAITSYTHEMVHVLQLALCGFPYRWASELFELTGPAVQRLRSGRTEDDFGPILDAIKLGESAFTVDEIDALTAHFAQLDEPCAAGFTTRSLLESHAHVVQRRVNYEIGGFAELAPHLEDAPGPAYRAAFDALAFAINPAAAFEWFPLVSAVALCTDRPAVAFNRLLLTLAAYPGYLPPVPTPDNALQAQRDLADIVDDELIGSASQVAHARGDAGAPLRRLVDAAEAAHQSETFSPSWWYAAPHEELEGIAPRLFVPVFLRPVEPQGLAVQLPPGMDQGTGLAYLTLAAVAGELTGAIEGRSRARGDRALDRLDWLRHDRRPIIMKLDHAQVAERDLSQLLRLSDPACNSNLPGREMARAWGRVALLAPHELDPDGEAVLATLPPVKELLQTLGERFPAFPVVLSWAPGMSGFVDWFGSQVPQAMHDAALDLVHPDVLTAVNSAAEAIYQLGSKVGQDPALAVQLMRLPVLQVLNSAQDS